MNKTKMKKGFTLFELLFVMAIISVVSIPALNGVVDFVSDTSGDVKQSVKRVMAYSNLYYSKNKTYQGMTYDKSYKEDITINIVHAEDNGYCVQATNGDVVYSFNSTRDANIQETVCTDLKKIRIVEKPAEPIFDEREYTFNPIFN